MHAARPGRRGAGGRGRGPAGCSAPRSRAAAMASKPPSWWSLLSVLDGGGLPGSPQITELGTSEPWTFPGLSARHPHKAPSSGVSPGSLL